MKKNLDMPNAEAATFEPHSDETCSICTSSAMQMKKNSNVHVKIFDKELAKQNFIRYFQKHQNFQNSY